MISPDPASPDPAQRPKLVVWAYRCWLIGAAVLGLVGTGCILLGIFARGASLLPVGLGIFVVAIGIAFVVLGTKTYVGDARWRSSLAALTMVVVLMLVFVSLVWNVMAFALLGAVIGLTGSMLAYRPDADIWFGGTPQPAQSAKKAGRGKR
ncbi:MAG: hypothetical protein QM673_17670 [Gordonia sp. (in: high G+C Gram-positive bacteria)]